MGYPLFNAFLPQYLQNAGKDIAPTPNRIVYRNYAITSIVGVPGSIIAAYTVDVKYIGRKYTIAVSTLITGILLFLFTLSSDSNYQLIFTCLEAFFQSMCLPHERRFGNQVLNELMGNDRHHVRRALRLHPGSISSTQPWHWHRNRILFEQNHRTLCTDRCRQCWKPQSECSCICFRRAHYRGFPSYVLLPYRNQRQAESVRYH